MKKMGIRRGGLLITSTIVRDILERVTKALQNKTWMVVGGVASQLWAYVMSGNCVYCRPTDNLNIVGIDIARDLEVLFKALAEGFIGDQIRRLNVLISHHPRFRVDIESYAEKRTYMTEFDRRVFLDIWNIKVPVSALEDHIIAKLLMGRDKDIFDIRNIFLAYKRYLRSNILMNTEPKYLIHLSSIKKRLEEEYPEMTSDVISMIESITGSDFKELEKAEDKPRKMVELLRL
ncbi:MAG: hypothetical protein ACTSX9_06115 [Candidatus Njordarchaeales archaeon]